MLAGQEAALRVSGEAVGLVGAGLEFGQAVGVVVAHATVASDVAEEQVATLLEPDRAFGGPPGDAKGGTVAAETAGEPFDFLVQVDDLFQSG